MNMRQLARLAGVSVSTVSKAFSGSREVSKEKREEIFRIAQKNGCYEKYRKMNFDRLVVAVLCPEFQSGYYVQQLDFFAREIKKRGGVVVTGSYDFDSTQQNELIHYFSEYVKVDGMILYRVNMDQECSVPTVVIGQSTVHDSVKLSMKNAIDEAIECFVSGGHTSIAFIGDPHTEIKRSDFVRAMQRQGMEVSEDYKQCATERFEEGGYRAMNRLLDLPNPPTAVLAAYDGLAFGAMKSIREHGLKIPQDISIIGMDDTKEGAYMEVPLSSITSYNEEFCEIIINMLFDRMKNGPEGKPKHVNVSSQLVHRATVGPAPKK